MTNKEALDWCEQFTDNLVMVDVDTKKRTLGLQAMQVCKSALEKQIPKRVKIEVVDDFDPRTNEPYQFKIPICTACGENIALRIYKYCPNCGQTLDWGNAE